MNKATFTADDFTRQLTIICHAESSSGLKLNIDESKTWPHFYISCDSLTTPPITGYFVEGGTSYWQLSESGREFFTGNYESSLQFVDEIKEVIHVLNTVGCTETRWTNQDGRLARSLITIAALGKEILFGKRPPFWSINLIKQKIKFDPYDSCPK